MASSKLRDKTRRAQSQGFSISFIFTELRSSSMRDFQQSKVWYVFYSCHYVNQHFILLYTCSGNLCIIWLALWLINIRVLPSTRKQPCDEKCLSHKVSGYRYHVNVCVCIWHLVMTCHLVLKINFIKINFILKLFLFKGKINKINVKCHLYGFNFCGPAVTNNLGISMN